MTEVALPGTSPGYDKVEAAIETLIFDVALDKVISKIISAVPYLGYPVIKQVFIFILTKILRLLYKYSEEGIALLMIQNRVQTEKAAYDRAVEDMKKQLEQSGGMTDEAKKEFARRLRELVRIPPP